MVENNIIDDITKLIEETQKGYEEEYKTDRLNIVTRQMRVKDDKGDDKGMTHKEVTVVKYYTVKPKEYYTERQYKEHHGQTYQRYTYTVRPRVFYTVQEIETFLRYIDKIAGRTLEDDEKTLMLRHITNKRPYELVCVIDRTKELANQTMWRDR